MNYRIGIAIVLAISLTSFAQAQISFTYQVTNATCSSNGSIQVNPTGATGIVNYKLIGPCLQLPIVQQVSTFNNLPPCQYTLTATDGSNGSSASQTVIVGGNYQNPTLSLVCSSCAIQAITNGGAGPLVYSISSVGLGGPYVNNVPSSSPVFTNIQLGANYWVKVTDACGNFSVETCVANGSTPISFSYIVNQAGEIEVSSVSGGNGNMLYTLSSSNGTFTNSTGIFPSSNWGCSMSLTVTDGCTQVTKAIPIYPKVLSICSNFANGTATLGNVINGIPPYTLTYIDPNNNIMLGTGNSISGLPINANFYLFQVVDACGNKSDAIFKQKKYPVFLQDPVTCSENSISIFTPNGGCAGGFDADSWPFIVNCQTCNPVQTGQVDSADVALVFNGNTPGNWELAIEDGCEDQMVCRDSVILFLQPLCDSVQAKLIDRFVCDNGAISDRPMDTQNGVFKLFDNYGNLLGSNTTGLFYLPDSGVFKVTLALPNCGNHEAIATLGFWQPVNPILQTYIYNEVNGGKCQTVYQLVINPKDGPFYLTGGPNNISLLINGDNLTSTCQYYSITSLLPGDYQLAEVDHCGYKNLHLPAPTPNLEAVPNGNCPGSGTITVTGAQNLAGWQAWGAANNAIINWPSSITDVYSLDTEGTNSSQSSSPFTFANVPPGHHAVYLYTLGSTCAVDTFHVFVPEADPLKFDVSTGILCDGEFTTSLQFFVKSGKPPFVIEQVDCNNPSQIIASHAVQDSTLILSGFSVGDYCFRLVDSCVTSLDHQFSVQYFQDDIDLTFNCDDSFTLSVDSLNATYTWLDVNGNTVGNSHKITLQNQHIDATYTVLVNIGECVINRSIMVPATEIVPAVTVIGKPFFCQNETVTLMAATNATQIHWNSGQQTASISTVTEGLYTVTVTNGFGCTGTAQFQLTLDLPQADIETMSGGNGFGLKCFQDSNGVLLANPKIGHAPFKFEWSTSDTTAQISNLKTGTYSVIMTDVIGCKDTTMTILTEPDLFVPELDFYSPKCFGIDDGFIEVTGWSGGVGNVRAALENSMTIAAPVNFDNLTAGDFHLRVFDANGCTVDSVFRLVQPEELFMEIGDDMSIELGDSIFLAPEISFEPVDSFSWSTNNRLPITELKAWTTPLESSYYQLQVWDKYGCEIEDRLNVRVNKPLDIYVPTAFSPNGDGINDLFTIYAKQSSVLKIRSFQVFDRFGGKVFVRENFDPNEEPMGWDGRLKNQKMNPGVFVWKAEVEFIDGRIEQLYGDVTLMN